MPEYQKEITDALKRADVYYQKDGLASKEPYDDKKKIFSINLLVKRPKPPEPLHRAKGCFRQQDK